MMGLSKPGNGEEERAILQENWEWGFGFLNSISWL
jgi:hypothetical protein